ncbi:MAG: tetratricopeptide repeat protein [Promethearchaeota archaeon]
MPSCIICHLEIREEDGIFTCPNGHPSHANCLREWLCHSFSCPLCSTKYSDETIAAFRGYIEKKKQEELEALKKERMAEDLKKIEKIAEKMVFYKFIENIETLIDRKEYELALERLDAMEEFANEDYKKLRIMFLKGKINYLRGRYDLAINLLFKLVKIKFDYPDAFLYLGKSYEQLGLADKAKWAYDRVKK